jgi:hypothetical protein
MSYLHWLTWLMWWDWRLRTATISGLLFISQVNVSGEPWRWWWCWRDNSWLVYQSSLAVLPAETSGASWRNGWMNENFAYSVSLIRQRIFYMPQNLTTWDFTSHPKEGVMRIFIALKIPLPPPGLNPRRLGPVANTLTTTPSRRHELPP